MADSGPRKKAASTAAARTASGPINRSLIEGPTRRLKAIEPTTEPRAAAARNSPTVADPPPSIRASGAATPSGTS